MYLKKRLIILSEDIYRKKVWLKNRRYELEIIDTAGPEEYSALRDQYVRISDGFMVVCSYVDRTSFENMVSFVEQIMRVKDSNSKYMSVVIVINKVDLPIDMREFTLEQVLKFADSYDIAHVIETSAKTNHGVLEAYTKLSSVITDLIAKEPSILQQLEDGKEISVKNVNPDNAKSEGCCVVN
jgi:GTPase KRas protein